MSPERRTIERNARELPRQVQRIAKSRLAIASIFDKSILVEGQEASITHLFSDLDGRKLCLHPAHYEHDGTYIWTPSGIVVVQNEYGFANVKWGEGFKTTKYTSADYKGELGPTAIYKRESIIDYIYNKSPLTDMAAFEARSEAQLMKHQAKIFDQGLRNSGFLRHPLWVTFDNWIARVKK